MTVAPQRALTPAVAYRAARLAARYRRTALTLAGLGLLSAAGWRVAAGLGLAVAGLSCIVLEWLTGDDDTPARPNRNP